MPFDESILGGSEAVHIMDQFHSIKYWRNITKGIRSDPANETKYCSHKIGVAGN